MDYYKKMAQPKMDFSVFKPKRSKRAEEQESSAENTAKSIPNPKAVKEQETPVQEPKAKQSQEDIPVSSETKNERKSELTALELQVDQSMSEQKESEESGKVIRFRVPENRNEEAYFFFFFLETKPIHAPPCSTVTPNGFCVSCINFVRSLEVMPFRSKATFGPLLSQYVV